MSARGRARKPRELFERNGEDSQVGGSQGAAHGVELNAGAETVDEARPAEGFHVMEDDGDAGSGGSQDLQDTAKLVRKTARGPGEGGVLNEDPAPAPRRRLEAQGVKGIGPAVNFPRNAEDFQLKIVGLQGGAKIAAILLDGVRGHVSASEKSDDGRGHLGRAST